MIEFGHGTHIGLRRDHNEDTYQADSSAGLWLVADGMGGHEHGEVASAIARDTISAQIANGTDLVEAIREADRAIMAVSHARDGNLPMGTTVAALKITANRYQVAWVGDSRVYLADTDLQQLSRDHSFVRQLVDRGAISEDEARRHPRRNEVTQALGITPAELLQVSFVEDEIRPGTQFLVCSDGLTEEVEDAAIRRIVMRQDLSAQECVDQLIAAALEGGGSDNITALLVRLR